LVEVESSLVSPGTEVRGWHAFSKIRNDPGDPKQTKPFGYSNAGVILAVGKGVTRFSKGDRVACVGGGKAMHTDYAVVPHNLTVPLPDGLTFDQGAYAMLAATALQALRRGDAEFGGYTAIVGLGIVGQLTAQLHQLVGCYTIGWDTVGKRIEVAKSWGINATATVGKQDEVALTQEFTAGAGLDDAVIAFGGSADSAMESLLKCMKVSPDGHAMGAVVVVGGAEFHLGPWLTNMDIRRSSRTGPGYHDDAWEVGGPYPPVFMRWTTPTNLELCLRLVAEGRLKVDGLTTHTLSLTDIDAGTSEMLKDPDGVLGVIIRMK
jgi:threonine dehydrogenase-like Zn-dependent dehydrogenase